MGQLKPIDPDIVPTGGNELHIHTTHPTPAGNVITLGSRRSLSDVVSDLRAQTSALSRQS